MEPGRSPAQLIAESKGLLLDFDGPVCDVYAGSDPARIAREVATAFDLEIDTDDPLDLITYALATDGPVEAIHQALAQTEIEALGTATETPGIRRTVESYHGPIAIVSNNAREAIETWLAANRMGASIAETVGRDPYRMKPDPSMLLEAIDVLAISVKRCVFVGDSVSDARAAEAAGVKFIGLANRPHKRSAFASEGYEEIIDGLDELVPKT